MNWSKVIENLHEQSNFYANQANEMSMKSGFYDSVKEMRTSANTASILASALSAGLAASGPPLTPEMQKGMEELQRQARS